MPEEAPKEKIVMVYRGLRLNVKNTLVEEWAAIELAGDEDAGGWWKELRPGTAIGAVIEFTGGRKTDGDHIVTTIMSNSGSFLRLYPDLDLIAKWQAQHNTATVALAAAKLERNTKVVTELDEALLTLRIAYNKAIYGRRRALLAYFLESITRPLTRDDTAAKKAKKTTR